MTFIVRKKIELSFLGDGWQEAYVIFTPFTFADNTTLLKLRSAASGKGTEVEEAEEASKKIMDLLKDKFIEGKGWNGKELIAISKDTLKDLPMESIGKLLNALQGATALPPNG